METDASEATRILLDLIELGKIVLPAALTLLAGYLAYRFAVRRDRANRLRDFRERQLRELYSPMLGYLRKVRAASTLRQEFRNAAGKVWPEIAQRTQASMEPLDASAELQEEFKSFRDQIAYDNQQLRELIVPLYDQMLRTFTDNFWLAEPSTRSWFDEFFRFVEIWHRFLEQSAAAKVFEEIDHREERLEPFYSDLEDTMDRLRSEVAGDG